MLWNRPIRTAQLCCSLFLSLSLSGLPSAHADGWTDDFGIPGSDEKVQALCVYDGDLVAGGWTTQMDDELVGGVARWDGVRWSRMGTTRRGFINDFMVHDGVLYAAGQLLFAGDDYDSVGVFRWDGSGWEQLGDKGEIGEAYSLAVFQGDLYAAVGWTVDDESAIRGVARWAGDRWENVGGGVEYVQGMSAQGVNDLIIHDDRLIAAGGFVRIGGIDANRVATWDGSHWSTFGEGFWAERNNRFIEVDRVLSVDGVLYAHGDLVIGESQAHSPVAQWDGESWQTVGESGELELFQGMVEFPGIGLVAARREEPDGFNPELMLWTGEAWTHFAYGTGVHSVSTSRLWLTDTVEFEGRTIVCGTFVGLEDEHILNIAAFSPSGWEPVNGSFRQRRALHTSAGGGLCTYQGELVTTGRENGLGPVVFLRWRNDSWERMGDIIPNSHRYNRMAEWRGDLVAAGYFGYSSPDIGYIARWNGESWSSLDATQAFRHRGRFNALVNYDGLLVAVGDFEFEDSYTGFMVHDGEAWGTGGVRLKPPTVYDRPTGLRDAVEWNGRLAVAGYLSLENGQNMEGVSLWDGSEWEEMPWPFPSDEPRLLAVAWGDLFAAGYLEGVQGRGVVARWDGERWDLVDGLDYWTQPQVLFEHAGSLLVGAGFKNQSPFSYQPLWRLNAEGWEPLPALHPTDSPSLYSALSTGDSFWITGDNTRAGDFSSYGVARYEGAFPNRVPTVLLNAGQTRGSATRTLALPLDVSEWRPSESGTGPITQVDLAFEWTTAELDYLGAETRGQFEEWTLTEEAADGAVTISMTSASGPSLGEGGLPLLDLQFRSHIEGQQSRLRITSVRAFGPDGTSIATTWQNTFVGFDCAKGQLVEDGELSTADVARLLEALVTEQAEPVDPCTADVNADDAVDLLDAAALLHQVVLGNPEAGTLEPSVSLETTGPGTIEMRVESAGGIQFEYGSEPLHGWQVSALDEATIVAQGTPNGDGKTIVAAVRAADGPIRLEIKATNEIPDVEFETGQLTLASTDASLLTQAPTQVVQVNAAVPDLTRHVFRGASPNPFNPRTAVRFVLAHPDRVDVRVYDLAGRLVATLTQQDYQAGVHEVPWTALDSRGAPVGSGVYLIRAKLGDEQFVGRAVLVR